MSKFPWWCCDLKLGQVIRDKGEVLKEVILQYSNTSLRASQEWWRNNDMAAHGYDLQPNLLTNLTELITGQFIQPINFLELEFDGNKFNSICSTN